MPIIYTYPSATPTANDLLVFSDVSATDPAKDTRKCTIGDIVNLIGALVPGGGTVTSVGLSGGTTGLTISDTGENPIVTSGTFTVGGTLVVANGGTGANTFAAKPLRGAGGTGPITAGDIDLTSEVMDILPELNGGTGHGVYAVGDILYASGTTTLSRLAGAGAGTLVLTSGGVGVAPSWTAPSTTGLVTTFNVVAGDLPGLTPIAATSGAITLGGNLGVGGGGTGRATLTNGAILVGAGTSQVTLLGPATNGQLLIGGTGLDPVFSTLTAGPSGNITITNTSGSIEIEASGDGIYDGSGSLSGDTTVTMTSNDLTFNSDSTGRFSVETAATSVVNSTTVVEVFQAADLPATLAANTTYVIRGTISTNTPIAVTNSGSSIIGIDRNRDKLVWTGLTGTTMLTITNVDFDLSDVWLSSTITGSVLIAGVNYDDTAYNKGRDKILTITNCQIRNCFDVMSIEGFDLVDINNTLFFYVEAPNFGLQFLNTSKIEISSCELIRWFDETSLPTPAGYSTASMIEILDNAGSAGTPPGIGAINVNGCIIHPQQTQNGININTGSTTAFGTIAANTFINVGLTTGEVFLGDALTPVNGAYSETECLNYDIFSNQGVLNSTSGVVMTMTGNATVTALTVNTPVVVDTGGLAVSQSNVRYTVSTAGRCTYNGSKQVYVSLHTSLSYNKQGAGVDDYDFQFFKNGVLLPGSATLVEAELNGAVGMVYGTLMSQNDYIEVYVENTSSNDDMLVTDWQVLIRE